MVILQSYFPSYSYQQDKSTYYDCWNTPQTALKIAASNLYGKIILVWLDSSLSANTIQYHHTVLYYVINSHNKWYNYQSDLDRVMVLMSFTSHNRQAVLYRNVKAYFIILHLGLRWQYLTFWMLFYFISSYYSVFTSNIIYFYQRN